MERPELQTQEVAVAVGVRQMEHRVTLLVVQAALVL
jgi:hypothetical protein